MSVGETLVAIVVGIWIGLTILNQMKRTRRWVTFIVAYDVLGLIPIWTFFAPNPGNTDTHLLYRDLYGDGTITQWKELNLVKRRNVLHIWQPKRRISKAVVDVFPDLLNNFDDNETVTESEFKPLPKTKMLSFPYILLLNLTCMEQTDIFSERRQFAIAKTNGHNWRSEPTVFFVSAFHEIR